MCLSSLFINSESLPTDSEIKVLRLPTSLTEPPLSSPKACLLFIFPHTLFYRCDRRELSRMKVEDTCPCPHLETGPHFTIA